MSVQEKIKLLFAIRSLDIGGAERLVLSLANSIDKSRFDVTIVSMYDGVLDANVPEGVELVKARKVGRFGYLGFLKNLVQAIETIRPDILYTHLGEMNLFCLLANHSLSFRPKIIWCFHSAYLDYSSMGFLSRVIFKLQKLFSAQASKIVCVSDEVRRYHAGLGFCEQNMCVIDNGVDTTKFVPNAEARKSFRAAHGIGDDEVVVGMSARIDKIKGYELFAACAKILLEGGAKMRFVQMGGGDEAIKNECIWILGSVADRFVWLGSQNEPQNIYPAFDICVSASLGEAFSLSVAEAMSCGVSVVASDVGVFRALVGDGGVVVEAGNAKALADAIMELAHKDLIIVGKIARAHIEQNYSLAKTVHLTQALFEESLS